MRSARKFIKPASGWGSEGNRRKICTSLPPEVMEQLSLRAEREGKSISSTIADLVEAGLQQKGSSNG